MSSDGLDQPTVDATAPLSPPSNPELPPPVLVPPPPGVPPAPAPAPLRLLSVGLTRAVQVLFGLVALASLAMAAVFGWNWSRFEAARSASVGDLGPVDDFVSAEDLLQGTVAWWGVVALILGVLFVVWMWKAHRIGDQFRPVGRRWRVGWTIGGWLIPFANLVIPKLVMNEIQRTAVAPLRDGQLKADWQREDETLACDLWWFASVFGIIAFRVGAFIAGNVDNPLLENNTVVASYVVRILGSITLAVSAIAGVRLVEEVRRGFEDS